MQTGTDPIALSAKVTALVTGADGFVGRHLVAALVQAGRSVRATDLQFGTDLPDGVEARVADILDAAAMASAMDGVETVYHLAAISDLWTPARDAGRHHRVNVTGTETVLEAAIAAGVRRFVYCSSNVALIAGPRRAVDVDETYRVDRAALFGAYARSKHDAGALVSRAADRIEVVIARPGTPIGPGDHRPTPPGRLLRDLANGTLPALPMGGSINLVDVRLLADALARAGDMGQAGAEYLLTGCDVSFGTLADAMTQVTGLPMPRERVPYPVAWAAAAAEDLVWSRLTARRPNASFDGVRMAGRQRRFSNALAKRDLGLGETDLQATLRAALDWMVHNGMIDRVLPGLDSRTDTAS